jgi:general secretion pathway protein B
MSFILDALRKSELERQRQFAPGVAEFPLARPDRRLPVALVAIGVLLALNVGIVLFFVLRDSPAPAAQATPASAPSAVSMSSAAAAPPRRRAAPETSPDDDYVPGEELPDVPPEIYGDGATAAPDAPDPTLLPDAPVAGPDVTYTEAPPTPITELPAEATAGLPELSVDLHIYAEDPAKRAVFINGRRYLQGAQIAEGPVVEEITRDGAVLKHRGRRFLLPRL